MKGFNHGLRLIHRLTTAHKINDFWEPQLLIDGNKFKLSLPWGIFESFQQIDSCVKRSQPQPKQGLQTTWKCDIKIIALLLSCNDDVCACMIFLTISLRFGGGRGRKEKNKFYFSYAAP